MDRMLELLKGRVTRDLRHEYPDVDYYEKRGVPS